MILQEASMESPVGRILVHVNQDVVCGITFENGVDRTLRFLHARFGELDLRRAKDPAGVITRLRAYFKGDLHALDPIQVDTGGTPFQRSVWRALRRIPTGKTISYAELARRVRRPSAFRAVGAANGSNPVSIVVPCHRVIGADGSLTGYGGGLDRKRWLLRHEGAFVMAQPGLFA